MSREYGFNRQPNLRLRPISHANFSKARNARRKIMREYAKRAKGVITAKNSPYKIAKEHASCASPISPDSKISEAKKCIVSNTCYCAFAEPNSPVARLLD